MFSITSLSKGGVQSIISTLCALTAICGPGGAQGQALQSSTDTVLHSSTDDPLLPAPETRERYERTKDIPGAAASTVEAFHHAAETTAEAHEIPLYRLKGPVAAFESPGARVVGAAAKGADTLVTAVDVFKTSYDCSDAARAGGIAGLQNCAGEVADTGVGMTVGAIGSTGPLGTAFSAGYAVGKVAQQALSAITQAPTLNDQLTDYLSEQYAALQSSASTEPTSVSNAYTEKQIRAGTENPPASNRKLQNPYGAVCVVLVKGGTAQCFTDDIKH